ncbi:outer membrane protein [Haliscomenobacter sp.]|uniref:outer membrane protein n=1 Tax=Haliscomenobacter sp. TaxID=2717303 RepID=UPI00359331BF
MEQPQFDRLIREKLENLNPEFRADHWQRMEEAMSFDEELEPVNAAESAFDREVLQQMRHFNVGAAPRHWARLRRRMEEALYLRKLILGSKFGEVLVFTLALLLFVQLPLSNPENKPSFPDQNTAPQQQAIAGRLNPPTTTNHSAAKAPKNNLSQGRNIRQDNKGHDQVFSYNAPEVEIVSHPNHQVLSTLESANLTLAGKTPELEAQKLPIEDPNQAEAMSNYYVFGNQLTPLAQQRSNAVSARRLNIFEANTLKPFRKKTLLSAAMFGGSDYNQIITPANEENRTDAFIRYALGYSGGILFSAERGRWELGTGLIYAAKPYNPRQIIKLEGSLDQGYTKASFNQVALDIINIPFHARYNFFLHKRSRLYAVIGGSLQVAASTSYFITTTSSNPGPLKPEMRDVPFDNTSGGILEGGSVKENGYITGNLGLGVEHFMSDRWSLFAQPTYQHSLGHFSDGFGPSRDRINTLSLWMGIRVRILE